MVTKAKTVKKVSRTGKTYYAKPWHLKTAAEKKAAIEYSKEWARKRRAMEGGKASKATRRGERKTVKKISRTGRPYYTKRK